MSSRIQSLRQELEAYCQSHVIRSVESIVAAERERLYASPRGRRSRPSGGSECWAVVHGDNAPAISGTCSSVTGDPEGRPKGNPVLTTRTPFGVIALSAQPGMTGSQSPG